MSAIASPSRIDSLKHDPYVPPNTADTAQGMFTDDADLSTVKQRKLRTLVRTTVTITVTVTIRRR